MLGQGFCADLDIDQVDSDTLIGQVSQSGQWAPYNPNYEVRLEHIVKPGIKLICTSS